MLLSVLQLQSVLVVIDSPSGALAALFTDCADHCSFSVTEQWWTAHQKPLLANVELVLETV